MRKPNQTLALTTKRLEEFLTEIANLRLEVTDIRRFLRRFPDFDLLNKTLYEKMIRRPSGYLVVLPDNEIPERLVIPYVRIFVRAAWSERDAQTRDFAWAVFRTDLGREPGDEFLDFFHLVPLFDPETGSYAEKTWAEESSIVSRFPQPPEERPIERAFAYLVRHHNLTRYCPNPECPAPYFLAQRHTQRYCSEKCAQTGEKEAKRKWWREHGPQWRKKQKRIARGKTNGQTRRQRKRKG